MIQNSMNIHIKTSIIRNAAVTSSEPFLDTVATGLLFPFLYWTVTSISALALALDVEVSSLCSPQVLDLFQL